MLRLILLAMVLPAAAGCSGGVICSAVGALVGVQVNVKAPLAARAESVAMEVCWDGSCEQVRTELHASTRAGGETCSGEVCSVTAVPTGDKHGFGEVNGLPKRPVEVRLALRGAAGEPVLARNLRVTPKAVYPNGPECGAGGPQVVLTVSGDGKVREGT